MCMKKFFKNIEFIILVCSILFYFTISLTSALRESLTYDEPVHIQEGLNALKYHTFTVDPYNPPFIRELLAFPSYLGAQRWISSHIPAIQALPGRIVSIIFGCAILFVIYRMTKKYFGKRTAYSALLLFTWEPTMLAYTHYAILDVGIALLFLLFYLSFLTLMNSKTMIWLIITSMLIGLNLASKIAALPYISLSIILLLILEKRNIALLILRYRKKFVIMSFIAAITLWSTYFFQSDVLIASRADPERLSSQLQNFADKTHNLMLDRVLYAASHYKIPLGNYFAAWKNSLVWSKMPTEYYLFGMRYSRIPWYAALYIFVQKIPIPLLVFFFYSSFFYLKKKSQQGVYIRLVIPVFVIFAVNSISRFNPNIRYTLPLYPFFIIIAALGFVRMVRGRLFPIAAIGIIWYVSGTIRSYPHFITYANEFAGPADKRFEHIYDSNLDWGQSLYDMKAYIDRTKPKSVEFSYFGTDNGSLYGLPSSIPYDTFRFERICVFHLIDNPAGINPPITAISVSNWYRCGYFNDERFLKEQIKDVVAQTILIFYQGKK